MHIDWGQIVTHVIGFLVAVWLLKHYAWEGLLGFVEKRRQTIVDSFDQIERDKTAVLAQKEEYALALQKIDEERRERIQEAVKEADRIAGEIKDEARRDVVAAREKAKRDIAIEIDKANETLKDQIIDAVISTTEKLIRERLDKDKHNQLIDDFLAEVRVN